MSLKKLRSVSFAGVDSLDDIKNHTYNELFVSGGFIVSDEFVLNPDFISQGKKKKPPNVFNKKLLPSPGLQVSVDLVYWYNLLFLS